MLFNSFPFIFCFLPIGLLGFFGFARISREWAAAWLLAASFAFYGWWDVRYLLLLGLSILGNFFFGLAIARSNQRPGSGRTKRLLVLAITVNLGILCYYKYADFFGSSLAALAGSNWQVVNTVLPLGISFFTFTQIAYLVDCARGKVRESNAVHYALFVTYFPHLIAGPVLHHEEMMPQFAKRETYVPTTENLAVGLTIFFIGLFKKIVIADGIAPHVGPVFSAAAEGHSISLLEAYGGALSYTFQLYFDFSGYSDMAIGLSRLFGIALPLNFNSPYKAFNIIEFWRRWHMTLSRFLRDYLYFSLGGNRQGKFRRYLNLLITMVLGGLWHGAAWTFVVWGGIHGGLLVINHGWLAFKSRHIPELPSFVLRMLRVASVGLTFYCVMIAWVFFRAPDLSTAWSIVTAMVGRNGIVWPSEWQAIIQHSLPWAWAQHFQPAGSFVALPPLNWFCWLLAVVWLLPNTHELMGRYRPALGVKYFGKLQWRPSILWGLLIAAMALLGLLQMSHVSEFLYFQF